MVVAVSEIDELLEYLGAEMKKRNWSMHRLSREAGLNGSYVSLMFRARPRPEPETLDQLAKALRVKPEVLLGLAGYPVSVGADQERPATPDEEEALRLLRTLPFRKRETALRVLRDLAEPYAPAPDSATE